MREGGTRTARGNAQTREVQDDRPRRLLDVNQLADRLSVSPTFLYRAVQRGEGPRPIRLGRLLRWDPRHVDRWLEAQLDGDPAPRRTPRRR